MFRHISLRHLRCFVEIAKTGSFTAAAARLYMTQSSLTNVIQQFEEGVGVKMFDRSTRRVSLTAEAERYLGEAEQLIRRFDASIADLRAFSTLDRGHLRLAAAASVIDYYLLPVIEIFRRQYPKITLSIRDSGAMQVERMVSDGALDFALAARHKGLDDLEYTPLLSDRYGILIRHDDVWASSDTALAWQSLDPARYLGFSDDTGVDSFLRKHARGFSRDEGPRDEVSSTTSLFSLMKIPGRYAILPALSAAHGAVHGLKFRPLKSPILMREICLISRRLHSLSPAAEAFLKMFEDVLHETPAPRDVKVSDRVSRA